MKSEAVVPSGLNQWRSERPVAED